MTTAGTIAGHAGALFENDPTCADDFRRAHAPSLCTDPERLLRLAVLQEAIEDLTKRAALVLADRTPVSAAWRAWYMQLRDWFARDREDWPYSLGAICDALGLEVEAIRRQMLAKAPAIEVHIAPRAEPPTIADRLRTWIAEQVHPFRPCDAARALCVEHISSVSGHFSHFVRAGLIVKRADGRYERGTP